MGNIYKKLSNKSKPVILLSITCLVMLMSSCYETETSSYSAKRGPLPDKNVTGTVLNLPMDSTLTELDPQTALYTNSFEVIGLFMEGLMQQASDGSVEYAICKEMTVSPDGLVYTFKLRNDVYWTNGDPVTADDFVYGWQRAVDPATGSDYAFLISDIAHIKNGTAIQAGLMESDQLGVKALDDYTLQVELTVPVAYFDQLLFFCTLYPAHRSFVESVGDRYCTSVDTVLGNGAFVLTEWTDDSVKLIKNTAYYKADETKLAGISYKLYNTTSEELSAFKSGKIDYMQIYGDTVTQMKDTPEFRTVDSGFLHYITFNLDSPAVENKNLRKALTFAFDRDVLANDILKDGSKGAYVAVPSGYAFNSKGQDFSKEGVEFPQYCAYNPDLAREYLAKAKAETGKDSFTIEFIVVNSSSQKAIGDSIKEQIESNLPGVTIELRGVERSSDSRDLMDSGDFEMGLNNWGPDYADPMTYLNMWQLGNSQNSGHYFNPHYEAILARCSDGDLCTKAEERWTALKQAEEMIMDDVVIMPLYQQCNSVLISTKVKNIDFHAVAISNVYKKASKY